MAVRGSDAWDLLLRLSTYAPPHALASVARGESPGPGRRGLEGAVLVADLSGFTALSETLGKQGRDGIDELHHILDRLFATLLERAVFPWGGALVKYAGDSLLSFFEGEEAVPRALAAALAAQAAMAQVDAQRPLAIRVGVGAGRFDLVTVGRAGERLDCFCAGDAAMRALSAVDDAGPHDVVLSGAGLPRGPFRAGSDAAQRLAGHALAPRPRPDSLGGVQRFDVRLAVERLRPYVAPEVWARIGGSPNAPLRAERRNACAVFCEIEGWDGDVALLGEHYLIAWEAARRHGGMLNKIDAIPRGPRLLAAFGVPSAHGDDERRALAFALELRDRLRAQVRIGVESGPLFAGEVGSRLKREFTVMGDTVNVAARLAHAAAPGQVLCGPDCWSRVDSFVGRPTPPLPLKGKSLPVTPTDVAAPRRFTAARLVRRLGHPPLVGRARESDLLAQAEARALAGEPQVLRVVGPPGIGKSALSASVADRWIDAGGVAFSVRCAYDRRDQAYLLARALLGAWLDLPLTPPPPPAAVASALDRLGLADPTFVAQTSAVLDPASATGDAASEHALVRLVASRLLRAVAARSPVLVVIDDGQHADAGSGELLQYVGTLEDRVRCLFLVIRRTGPGPGSGRKDVPLLEVAPLDREAGRALLARSLGVAEVSPLLDEAVEARARGNPLFVKRLAAWMSARGMVEKVGSRAGLSLKAAETPASALPPDLEALVNAEVDRLPPTEREVLRTVTVLGPDFGRDLAEALCSAGGVPPAAAREALQALAAAGLLMATGGAAPTYRFSRLSDREVIYGGLPAAERRGLHARAAAAMERQGAGDDLLAQHFHLADDHARAARACLTVAREAQRRGAYSDALRLFRAAGRHLAATGQDRTECEVAEVECLARLASYGEARELALALADRLTDPPTLLRVLTHAAMCASYEGDLAGARALLKRVRAGIPPDAPPALRADLLLMAASYHAAVGDPAEALVELAEARTLAAPQRAPVVAALQAGILAETGRAREARALADEALALADAGSHAGNRAFTRVSLGRALEACGEPVAAAERYREALALYSEAGQLANAANARMHAAQVDLERGRAQDALPELSAALETFRHFSSGQDETAARCALGRARFLLGDLEAALRDLEAAVALSETTQEHHAAIAGRAYLAQALWNRDPTRARELLARALQLGEERQMALERAIAQRIAAAVG